MVGGYGVAPSEYWGMTIRELELIHEVKRPKMIGSIHEDEYNHLVDRKNQLEAQGVKVL